MPACIERQACATARLPRQPTVGLGVCACVQSALRPVQGG